MSAPSISIVCGWCGGTVGAAGICERDCERQRTIAAAGAVDAAGEARDDTAARPWDLP